MRVIEWLAISAAQPIAHIPNAPVDQGWTHPLADVNKVNLSKRISCRSTLE